MQFELPPTSRSHEVPLKTPSKTGLSNIIWLPKFSISASRLRAKAWLSIIPVVFEKIAYLALRLGSLSTISLLLIIDKPSTPFFMPF